MSFTMTTINARADLGDAWFRYQVARISQRYQQCGAHFRLDIGALLARSARSASSSGERCVPGPATLGVFMQHNTPGACAQSEWIATLADMTEVVVPDFRGLPSAIGIQKAVSVVQSRAYLEQRAKQLLASLNKHPGDWRLVTLDFGAEATHHACEFLMCFAIETPQGELSIPSPYVEIGFTLALASGEDPTFVLTIKTVVDDLAA